jgi:ABC-type Mn2+/Zn2+ transport system permease subunit
MLGPFELPFVQRGLIEVLILAVPAGLLGTWIVLRGLAFFSHAVGTAAFPGLVLADGLGFAAPLGAFGAALVFTAGNAALGRGRDRGRDSVVALILVGCLAAGVILASDVFGSGANVETLLFGSLLLIDSSDIALAAVAAAATIVATVLIGARWLAQGFDPGATVSGWEARLLDAALLGLIALATTAALSVVGALLVSALFVVPAATARLFTRRMRSWQLASVALVAAEGTAGLWLSVKTDAPPGATIACVAGAVFAIVALAQALARLPRAALGVAAATVVLALLASGCASSGSSGDGQI